MTDRTSKQRYVSNKVYTVTQYNKRGDHPAEHVWSSAVPILDEVPGKPWPDSGRLATLDECDPKNLLYAVFETPEKGNDKYFDLQLGWWIVECGGKVIGVAPDIPKHLERLPVETTPSRLVPNELLERLAWEHRDTSKYTTAINELRALLKGTSPEEPEAVRAARIGARIPYDIGLKDDHPGECGTNPPPEKASAPHVHVWEQDGIYDGAICKCGARADGWYCPDSPDHVCHYDKGNFDQCDHCGQPEERK
jgi:hypothetical protein